MSTSLETYGFRGKLNHRNRKGIGRGVGTTKVHTKVTQLRAEIPWCENPGLTKINDIYFIVLTLTTTRKTSGSLPSILETQ